MKNILIVALFLFGSMAYAQGLKVGESVPSLAIKDTTGNTYQLDKLSKKTVLIFYRGAWCPYCVKQLKSVNQEVQAKIDSKEAQLFAISVDNPRMAKKMKAKFDLKFQVISDSSASSLKAFKIVNQLTPELVKKYKNSYQIDIEGDSGQKHHMIAHPAVFIIQNGKILFADVHTDYKQRTSNSTILKEISM